ncbi:MAG: ferrous iron transporter B [Gammaproteobacteria bacterium]|nr:MAG: ferrous iron transporter B [Gammaproteobacteria bacterium]
MKIVLIGNPNSGKTTVFNKLTGLNQRVGNWAGVTVDKKTGNYNYNNKKYEVIDLPGLYDLGQADSTDEHIARDYILENPNDLYINIINASTLDRGLYLTLQLRDMGLKCLLVLNMMDVVKKEGIAIDLPALTDKLSCPVVPISMRHKKAGDKILSQIEKAYTQKKSITAISYGDAIDNEIKNLIQKDKLSRREILIGMTAQESKNHKINEAIDRLADHKSSLSFRIADYRFNEAHNLSQDIIFRKGRASRSMSDKIDKLVLGKYTALPIFLIAMYVLFFISINVGGAFIDFFDMAAGTIFIDGTKEILSFLNFPQWLQVIIGDGLGGGVQVVATFIPIIMALYLFLTFLEESGYMSRAAFVMDRMMRRVGISGKSFVPLIIGFGCNVPGIMAARTLGTERERILTVLMAPFMSCGARLPVYALFAAAFFSSYAATIVLSLYLIGIIFAMITAKLFGPALGGNKPQPLIIEMPVYQLPALRELFINMWHKTRGFIVSAGKIIVLAVAFINITNSLGTDFSFGNENTDKSMLSSVSKSITPIFKPMGINQDNWQATVGIVAGVLAKEVVVGTLDTLYTAAANKNQEQEEEQEYSLIGGLSEAISTIPANLKNLSELILDPLGFSILDDADNIKAAAKSQEVDEGTFGQMRQRFDGAVGAYAYLLFILLYAPCFAAAGAMVKEAGNKWGIIGIGWSTILAYFTAVIFYQIGTINQHLATSLLWLGISACVFIGIFFSVKIMSKNNTKLVPRQQPLKTSKSCRHCEQ